MHLLQRVYVYGYSNARTKAMKSLLIPESKIRELIAVPSIHEIIEILEGTAYRSELIELSTNYKEGDLVERALSKNLSKICSKLLEITPSVGKGVLSNILKRFEIHNLKSILVGKSLEYSKEEIERLIINIGQFDKEFLLKLLELSTLEEIVNSLANTEYKFLLNFIQEYKETHDPLPLLNSIDMYYYQVLSESGWLTDEKGVWSLIDAEVNTKNIINLLRAKHNRLGKEETKKLIISGGSILPSIYKVLEKEKMEDVVKELKNTYDLSEAYEKYKKDGSLAHFEIELEKNVARNAVRTLRLSSLSLAAIMGYLVLKEIEIGNIRKIVRAKEFGLPAELIKEMVFAM